MLKMILHVDSTYSNQKNDRNLKIYVRRDSKNKEMSKTCLTPSKKFLVYVVN